LTLHPNFCKNLGEELTTIFIFDKNKIYMENQINQIHPVKYREAVISPSAKLFNRVNNGFFFFFSFFKKEVGLSVLK